MPHRKWMLLAAGAASLGACSVREPDNTQGAVTTADTGVARETVAAPTPTPSPIQQAAIQTQPGPMGNNVALNKAAVTGDILTVSLTYSGGNNCCVHVPLDQVSVIDDATSQRISVLKDNSGKWIAAPLEGAGTSVTPDSYKQAAVVWFKFPAPPATSKTVSITIPGVAPFDAVPVTR